MFIASLKFNVRPDKREEFKGAAEDILERVRSQRGCLGCFLRSDCENECLFVLTCEWDTLPLLERSLASPEIQILEGTRFLLRDGPELSIDEVLSRRRTPRPKSLHSPV